MRLPPVALLALLALAAAPGALAEEPPVPPAPPEAVPAPIATVESDDDLLQRITGEMMVKVEEIRGLKFKSPVERVWKSRDEARAEMLEELEKQAEKQDLAAVSKVFAFFGLIKDGQDLKTLFADFIAAGAGGYYIPEKKVFSLIRGMNLDANRPVVFHELVHAVEDQYFDWNERTERYTDEDRSDPAEALHAVVEGSARFYENRFVDSEPGLRQKYEAAQMQEAMKQMGAMFKAPPSFIIAIGVFPYENGSLFLKHVLPELSKGGGGEPTGEAEALASIYSDPPMSTEQILHPEKYLGTRDLPRRVALAEAAGSLGEGWKEILQDTMGEFSLGLVLNASLFPNVLPNQIQAAGAAGGFVKYSGDTGKAVGGWDADRYALYESKEGLHCLAWVTAWDSPEDAAEFAEVYGKVVARKYTATVKGEDGKSTRQPPGSAGFDLADWSGTRWTGTRWTGTRGGDTAIVVKGDVVILAERVPEASLPAFLGAVAKSTILQDPKDGVPGRKTEGGGEGGAAEPPPVDEGGIK